jgi:hypothetical protein
MGEADWTSRVAKYRQQGRPESEIREIAEHLAQRGPNKRTPAERAARAMEVGVVAPSEYMDSETEMAALAAGPDGFPNAWLERVRDRLLVVTARGWVNPRSRTAWRAGLYQFNLRGAGYYQQAAQAGDFTPGASVTLVRQPDNAHDPNAVAVYADGARTLAGYVPKGTARRIAKMLDEAVDLVAVSTRGGAPGDGETTPAILVCERAFWERLNGRR